MGDERPAPAITDTIALRVRGNRALRIYAIGVIAGLLLLLWLARAALAPFLLGLLVVYMLLPVVHLIERHLPDHGRWVPFRRPIAAIGSAVAALLLLVLLLGILLSPVVEETSELFDSLGLYWDTILAEYPTFRDWYVDTVPEQLREWVDANVRSIGQAILAGVAGIFTWLLGKTGSLVSAGMALISIPLFVIYYLLDEPRTSGTLRHQLPARWSGDAVAIFRIVDRILGSYTRGVMLEAAIVGVITGLGYWLIGVDLALPLGVIAFAGEIVPIIGPWIAFAISFPVVLATQPELAIPAIFVFLVIQALESWFLAPRIQGGSVEFTSAGALVILAVGSALAGGLGIVFALPAAAILRAGRLRRPAHRRRRLRSRHRPAHGVRVTRVAGRAGV